MHQPRFMSKVVGGSGGNVGVVYDTWFCWTVIYRTKAATNVFGVKVDAASKAAELNLWNAAEVNRSSDRGPDWSKVPVTTELDSFG